MGLAKHVIQLRAIVAGEHDPYAQAALKNVRVRAGDEEVARSLHGNWRAEHLFALEQALDAFDFCGRQLAQCDGRIEAQLERLRRTDSDPAKGKQRGSARYAPKFDRRDNTAARNYPAGMESLTFNQSLCDFERV